MPLVTVTPDDYFVSGDPDDTLSFGRALAFLGDAGTLYLNNRTYSITAGVTVSGHSINIEGAGRYSTQINFTPTAHDQAAIKFDRGGGNSINNPAIRKIGFYSTDSSFRKIAIEIVDANGGIIEEIACQGSVEYEGTEFWGDSSHSSVGILTRGRETGAVRTNYIYADIPIRVAKNPNNPVPQLDIDHWHFQDNHLAATSNPCFLIDDDVFVSNLTIDGFNPWVLGEGGLFWHGSDLTVAHYNLTVTGVRTEQTYDSTKFSIDIDPSATVISPPPDFIRTVYIRDCYLNANGIRLRNTYSCQIDSTVLAALSGQVAFDVDASVLTTTLNQVDSQVGATVALNDQNWVWGSSRYPTNAPMPRSGMLRSVNVSDHGLLMDDGIRGKLIAVSNGAAIALASSTTQGFLIITDSEGLSAIFELRGGYHATTEVSDTAGVYSAVAGTAGSTNIYWSGTNSRYEIQNLRTVDRRYYTLLVGSDQTF